MREYTDELSKILQYLSENPEGRSVGEVADQIGINRNAVAKYLDVLHLQGRIDIRAVGRAKIFYPADRVPFTTVSKMAPFEYIGVDKDNNVKAIAPHLAEQLGEGAGRRRARNLENLPLGPLSERSFLDKVRLVARGRSADLTSESVKLSNGRHYQVSVYATVFLEGDTGAVILLRDVTESEKAKIEGEIWKARFDTTIKDVPLFIVHFLPDRSITFASEAFAASLDISSETVIGQKFDPVCPPDDRVMIMNQIQNVSWESPKTTVEYRVIAQDGSIQWQQWTFRAAFQDEIIREYHGTGIDITSLRAKDDQIQKFFENYEVIVRERTAEMREVTRQLSEEIEERKQTESALMKSETQYRELANNITDIFFIMDQDLHFRFWNKASEKLTGISAKNAIGRSITEIFTDKPEISRTIKVCREVINKKQPQNVVSELDLKGKHLIFEVNAYPALNGVAVFAKDITERKHMEEALRLKDFAIESSINGIALADLDGNLTYVNPAFLSIWGYGDRREVLGRSVLSFWEVQDEAQLVFDGLQKQGTCLGELVGQRKDGKLIHIQLSANMIRDPYGTPVATMGSFIDITERKRSEEALRHREHEFSTLVETASDMIVHFDTSLRYIHCNPAVERMLGIPVHTILGKTPLESGTRSEHLTYIEASLRRTLETGEEQEVEQTLPTPSGLRHFLTRITPERTSDGSIISLLTITRDITERKREEEEFRERTLQQLKVSYDNLQKTKADLMLHQTELETQNEELRRTQADLEESRERFFELYDLAPAGYLTISEKGLILNANLTAANLLGEERKHLEKKMVNRYIVPDDQDIFYHCRRALIKSGERQSCELRMLNALGLPLQVQIIAGRAPGKDDGATISLMVIDISPRKLEKDALQTNKPNFHGAFESHASVMLLIDPETGRIIDANLAAERFYGRTIQELCTLSIDAINTLPIKEQALKRKMAVKGEVTVFIFQHRLFSGEIRTVEVHSSPVTMEGKTILFSIIHDITDRDASG